MDEQGLHPNIASHFAPMLTLSNTNPVFDYSLIEKVSWFFCDLK